MLKNKLYPYIEKYINEYLYGFSKEQLNVGVMNGQIVLEGLNIRPDRVNEKLDSFEIPIWLKAGQIKKIRISCSLMNFIGEKPLEVYIDDIDMLLAPSYKWILKNAPTFIEENEHHIKEPYDPLDNNSHDIFSKKVNIYDSSILKQKQKLFEIFKDKSKISEMINKIFTKCLKFYYQKPYLINFKIKNVHVRFEDEQLLNYFSDIAFGIKINNLEINLSADGVSKKNNFKCEGLNIYWEPKAKMNIPSRTFIQNLDRDNNINEKYYDSLKNVNFSENKSHFILILDNFNFMGNFGISILESGNLDFFAKNREKNFKFYLQFATSELNLNIYPDFVEITERVIDFMKSFFIIEPIQDFKPMRKPYRNCSEVLKKVKNESSFNMILANKRKKVVRDWLYYLVWFHRFKKAIYGNVFRNPLHSEFSKYFNICCLASENQTEGKIGGENLNDSINVKKSDNQNDSFIDPKNQNLNLNKDEDPNPENINLIILSELLIKAVNLQIYPKFEKNDNNPDNLKFVSIKLVGVDNKMFVSKDKFEFSFDLKNVILNSLGNNKRTISKILDDKLKEEIHTGGINLGLNNNCEKNINTKKLGEYIQTNNESLNGNNADNVSVFFPNDDLNNISIITNGNNSTDFLFNNPKLNKKLSVLNETLDKISGKMEKGPNFQAREANFKLINDNRDNGEKNKKILNGLIGYNKKNTFINNHSRKPQNNFIDILLADDNNSYLNPSSSSEEKNPKLNLSKIINEYNKGNNIHKKKLTISNTIIKEDSKINSSFISKKEKKNFLEEEKVNLHFIEIYPFLHLNKDSVSVVNFKFTKLNNKSNKITNEILTFNLGAVRINLSHDHLHSVLHVTSEYNFIKKLKSKFEKNKIKENFSLKNQKKLFEVKNLILSKLEIYNNNNSKKSNKLNLNTAGIVTNSYSCVNEYKNYIRRELEQYDLNLIENGKFEVNYIFNILHKQNIEINLNLSSINLNFYNSDVNITSTLGKMKIPNNYIKFSFQSELRNFYLKLFDFEFNFSDSDKFRQILNNLIQIAEDKFKLNWLLFEPVIKRILEENEKKLSEKKNLEQNNVKNKKSASMPIAISNPKTSQELPINLNQINIKEMTQLNKNKNTNYNLINDLYTNEKENKFEVHITEQNESNFLPRSEDMFQDNSIRTQPDKDNIKDISVKLEKELYIDVPAVLPTEKTKKKKKVKKTKKEEKPKNIELENNSNPDKISVSPVTKNEVPPDMKYNQGEKPVQINIENSTPTLENLSEMEDPLMTLEKPKILITVPKSKIKSITHTQTAKKVSNEPSLTKKIKK